MTLKLLIFDCDGTIVDSQNAIVMAMDYAFDAAALPAPQRRAVLDIIGLSLDETFAVLAPDVTTAKRQVLCDHYRDGFRHLHHEVGYQQPLFDGAREVIETLSRRDDVLLAIATGKSVRGVERLLAREGLGAYFASVQTADSHPSKPHPGMILEAMQDVGAEARRTVMIGDTSFDMAMAVNAGVHALGVNWGYHPAERLNKAGADAICQSYDEVIPQIEALLAREA